MPPSASPTSSPYPNPTLPSPYNVFLALRLPLASGDALAIFVFLMSWSGDSSPTLRARLPPDPASPSRDFEMGMLPGWPLRSA
jgi:hypothetical protein